MAKQTRDQLLAVAFFAYGFWTAVWFGPQLIAEAKSTADWPVVRGEIDSAAVFSTSGRRRSRPFEVRTVYVYEVGGVRYRGTRHNVAGHLLARTRTEAEAFARERAVGSPVDVHYHPWNPSSSVLAITGMLAGWARTGLGALIALAGVVIGLRSTRA